MTCSAYATLGLEMGGKGRMEEKHVGLKLARHAVVHDGKEWRSSRALAMVNGRVAGYENRWQFARPRTDLEA